MSPLSPNQPSLYLGSHFRLPAASDERSPYWHDIAVPGVIDVGYRQAARCCFLDVLTPTSHHRTLAFDVVRSVLSASDFVIVDMRQRDFDQLRIPPMLVRDGAGHGAHAAADQPALEAHAFQGHVGGLAIAALAIYEWNRLSVECRQLNSGSNFPLRVLEHCSKRRAARNQKLA